MFNLIKKILLVIIFFNTANAMDRYYAHQYVERKAKAQQEADRLGNQLLALFKEVEEENLQKKPKSYIFPPDQYKAATDLIARGADVNFKDENVFNKPLLPLAVSIGDPLAVNLLLENGANVSGIDGRWALQSWLLYEYSWPQQVSTRILKLLASYGIELNYSDLNPLQRAAYTGNLDSVQLLLDGVPLQKNKEKELEEKFGKVRASYFSLLPLDIRKKVFSKAMVNIQTNKANPNIIDRHGNTALYHARQGFRLVEGKPMSRLSKHHPIFNMNFYRNNTINAVKIKNFIEIIDLLKDKMDPSLIPYSTDGY